MIKETDELSGESGYLEAPLMAGQHHSVIHPTALPHRAPALPRPLRPKQFQNFIKQRA